MPLKAQPHAIKLIIARTQIIRRSSSTTKMLLSKSWRDDVPPYKTFIRSSLGYGNNLSRRGRGAASGGTPAALRLNGELNVRRFRRTVNGPDRVQKPKYRAALLPDVNVGPMTA